MYLLKRQRPYIKNMNYGMNQDMQREDVYVSCWDSQSMMPGYQEYQFRNESGNARQETGGLRASQETGKPATNQEEGAVRRRRFFGHQDQE